MENKEKVYDEKISPLIKEIIAICKEEEIKMFAEFQYSETDFVRSIVHKDAETDNIIFKLYNILSQCKEREGVNVDKFFFNVARKFKNKSSIIMERLGNKAD